MRSVWDAFAGSVEEGRGEDGEELRGVDIRHHVTLCPLRPTNEERAGEGEVARGGK